MGEDKISKETLKNIVIHYFPFPVAVNLKNVYEHETWMEKTDRIVRVFEYLMRILNWILVSQYLRNDINNISDDGLIRQLQGLKRPSIGKLPALFFTFLRVYKSHPESSPFIKELEDLYWDASKNQKRPGIADPFLAIAPIRNKYIHEFPPKNDEEWKTIFDEIEEHFYYILHHLQFLKDYEMICILDVDNNEVTYYSFDGITIQTKKMDGLYGIDLFPNQFYLMHEQEDNKEFLQLNPFVIYEDFVKHELVKHDAGLLDKWSRTKAIYLATVLWETREKTQKDILDAIFNKFDNPLDTFGRRTNRLGWQSIKHAFSEISYQRMGNLLDKYSPALYLQRKEIQEIFEEFIESDKTCLVITGKSGVGKSNFVMALEDYYRDDARIAVIIFNCSNMTTKVSLDDQIQKNISQYITLNQTSEREDIWSLFDRRKIFANGKQLILFFDAINENPNSAELLHMIDSLVVENSAYPWLKVVITSRPESWNVISRKSPPTKHRYFSNQSSDEIGVELKEFGIKIDKFGHQEIELVYEKYRSHYNIKTTFDDLPPKIRQELRDPLILKLVSSTYRGNDKNKLGEIPKEINIQTVFDQYIDFLLADHKLEKKDLHFLKREIIPRMFEHFENTLLEDDFITDNIFYEKIFSYDTTSDGNTVNQSYINLVNSEILADIPKSDSASIIFKYERFYDYFGGEYIYKEFRNKTNNYLDIVDTIQNKPFLWGVLKVALVHEFKQENYSIFDQLVSNENQIVRELVIGVLEEAGNDLRYSQAVKEYISKLVSVDKPINFNQFLARLKIAKEHRLSIQKRAAARSALEIARRLEFFDILETGMFSSYSAIRVAAIRNIYYLWRNDQKSGYEILKKIERKILTANIFNSISMIDPYLGLTVLLLRHYYPNTVDGRELGNHVISVWRQILRKILFATVDQKYTKLFLAIIRTLVVNLLVKFIVGTQESYPDEKPSYLREIEYLINGSIEVKERYIKLLDYFENPTSLDNVIDDIYSGIADNDTFTSVVVWLIMLTEFFDYSDNKIPLLEDMIQFGLNQDPIGIYNQALIIALGFIGYQQTTVSDSLYEALERTSKSYLEKTKGIYYSKDLTKHPNAILSPQIILRARRKNPNDQDLAAYFLLKGKNDQDWDFISRLFDVLIPVVSGLIEENYSNLVLESIKVLFPLEDPTLESIVVDNLAKLRIYYPNEVDDFIISVDVKNTLLSKVLRTEPDEENWSEMFHNTYATVLYRILDLEIVKEYLVWFLRQAVINNNIHSFLKACVKKLLNLVADEEIFELDW